MNDKHNKRFPHNQAYLEDTKPEMISPRNSKNIKPNDSVENSPSVMSVSVLSQRVQHLEEQLFILNEENQEWKEDLTLQNNKLEQQLSQRDMEIQRLTKQSKEYQKEIKNLKDNLFKQNEQMQILHKQRHQEQKNPPVRVERINNSELQQKVLELSDEVSTLLVKIQQLIDQNNQQQVYIEDLQKALQDDKKSQQKMNDQLYRLNQENKYLKEEIKQVQSVAINQQTQLQNKYIKEIEEKNQQIQKNNQISRVEQYRTDRKYSQVEIKKPQDRQINSLKTEIQNLEEQLLQQKQIERSIKKKCEDKLRNAQNQNEALRDQISKLKQKCRQFQSSCSDYVFEIQQLQKEKSRKVKTQHDNEDIEEFKDTIVRLQVQKDELNAKIKRMQTYKRNENESESYNSVIHEAESKIYLLKEQLTFAEEQLARSRLSSKQITQLARRWEEDYRHLSKEYEDALKATTVFEERVMSEQAELARHKQIYRQLVKKYDHFEVLYKELEAQVHELEMQKGAQSITYNHESLDLIKLENSTLKQQISDLNYRLDSMKNHQQVQIYQETPILQVTERRLNQELNHCKEREKDLQRWLQTMRSRLSSQTTMTLQLSQKNQQLTDQLHRVNKALNEKERQFDQLKERYDYLHNQLNKKDQSSHLPKHHPELTRLKAEYVSVQRKLMENDMAAKNAIQNAEYQIQALKMENNHHRKKIQELLKELSGQRNSNDYRSILQSLELSEAKNKELERQLEHCQSKINNLHEQLKRPSSRQRKQSERKSVENHIFRPSSSVLPLQHSSRYSNMFQLNLESNKKPPPIENNPGMSIYEELIKEGQQLRNQRSAIERKYNPLSSHNDNFIPR